jgi:hypothetical protein
MTAAEKTLGLEQDEGKRQPTILRIDSGGGRVEDINWVLARGYQLHGKDYSGKRAQHLAESVVEWFDDPRSPERQVGWVMTPIEDYVRPVKRIAVRCRKKWPVGHGCDHLEPLPPTGPETHRPTSRQS